NKDLSEILDVLKDENLAEDAVVEDVSEEVVVEDASEEAAEDVSEEDVVEDVSEEAAEDVSEEVVVEDASEEDSEEVVEDVSEEAVVEDESPAEDVKENNEIKSEDKPAEEKKSKKNQLPEPDFDLADTIEGVRVQKDERETLITQIADEREEFNKVAKEQRKIRDELNASLKENLNKAIEFRNQRNETNKDVVEAKKLRNEVNKKIKNLEWTSGKRDRVKLENEIKKIDKIIETCVLDIKKENQLVKNANDLRKQLMEVHEDESVKGEAQELKNDSEVHHAKVVELSEKAQEAHENMLVFFRKTDEIRTAADDAHKQFIEARKNASSKHDEFKMVLSEIHVINKKLGTNRPKRRKSEKSSSSANKNREEKEKAESIFDKFKNGKKLSTEELLLLQKYNIN
ncbi:MAG: phosphoserine phosphatase SerB, partial [Methanobrevibacter sp.]|nr:phosphoserine phosphatase SerB [Methanobrevibacter sp.]